MNTKDPVNQPLVKILNDIGLQKLGIMNNGVWHEDPRRLVFTLSRYKFVSKMLEGKENVLEIGCGDGFAARIVKQSVQNLTISDYDHGFVESFKNDLHSSAWPIKAVVHNILDAPFSNRFDALYSLDVMEHIDKKDEPKYLKNITLSLKNCGTAIIGMPSLESQLHASPNSKAGHVNCKTGKDFKLSLEAYFQNVFLFSMNDEVVHTGYSPMAHYLLALCVQPKVE